MTEEKKYCTLEADKEGHKPVRCEKCGFICCSSQLEGGGQIADTGDSNDPVCPLCGSAHIEDYDGPYVDQSEMLFKWAKENNGRLEALYWDQYGKTLDLESKTRFLELSEHVRPEPAEIDDDKYYLTLPGYKVLLWFDNFFWKSNGRASVVRETKVTHFAHLPEPPK